MLHSKIISGRWPSTASIADIATSIMDCMDVDRVVSDTDDDPSCLDEGPLSFTYDFRKEDAVLNNRESRKAKDLVILEPYEDANFNIGC